MDSCRATFANGLAAGNISELAAGDSNNNTSACARALVRDDLGNPTTITGSWETLGPLRGSGAGGGL